MHLTKIEEFSFDHGQHFNTTTGEYHSLNPHTLGRPLTHTEMDYNLIYQKQTLNGFRICGSNNDLTLALSDLGARLQFTQISNTDADWARFQAAGLFDGQFVWNPVGGSLPNTTTTTAAPTTTTTTAAPTTTTTAAPPATVIYHAHTNTSWVSPSTNFTVTVAPIMTGSPYTIAGPTYTHTEGYVFAGWDNYSGTPMAPPQYQPGDQINLTSGSTTNLYARYTVPVYQTLTATPNPVDEGQNIVINLSGANIPDGRTVGWTITGVDTNDISGSLTGTFTMNSNQAEYIITVTNDQLTEGAETLTFTCAADDNAGTDCGLTADIVINDTSTTVVHNVTYQVQPGQYSSNISGTHPNTSSIANGTTITLGGPTWSLDTPYANWIFDGYAISDNLMAPVQYQPGDSYTVNGPVTFYARYSAPPTTTTTAAPTTTTTTTTAAPTYTVTINALANPSDIVGSHPLVQSGLSAGNFTLPGPTWSVTGYTFIGYDTYSGTPMAPPQYQPNDVINITANVTLYARYALTTTTSTTTTSTTTTTTAAPEQAYFFHLGNGTYPYVQDLIGGTWYKADNQPAASFAEGFADALANPGSYETINSVSSISNGDQFVFPTSMATNYYWLLIPDSYGIPDLTGVARLADTQNNINDVAAAVLTTTVNGQPYKLYRINLLPTQTGVTIQYNV